MTSFSFLFANHFIIHHRESKWREVEEAEREEERIIRKAIFHASAIAPEN